MCARVRERETQRENEMVLYKRSTERKRDFREINCCSAIWRQFVLIWALATLVKSLRFQSEFTAREFERLKEWSIANAHFYALSKRIFFFFECHVNIVKSQTEIDKNKYAQLFWLFGFISVAFVESNFHSSFSHRYIFGRSGRFCSFFILSSRYAFSLGCCRRRHFFSQCNFFLRIFFTVIASTIREWISAHPLSHALFFLLFMPESAFRFDFDSFSFYTLAHSSFHSTIYW